MIVRRSDLLVAHIFEEAVQRSTSVGAVVARVASKSTRQKAASIATAARRHLLARVDDLHLYGQIFDVGVRGNTQFAAEIDARRPFISDFAVGF